MREWSVRVRTVVETWVLVEAETEEDARREALILSDNDDLNDWATMKTEVCEVE